MGCELTTCTIFVIVLCNKACKNLVLQAVKMLLELLHEGSNRLMDSTTLLKTGREKFLCALKCTEVTPLQSNERVLQRDIHYCSRATTMQPTSDLNVIDVLALLVTQKLN